MVPLQATPIDGVLQSAMMPITTITIITLHGNAIPAHIENVLLRHVADQIADLRVGARITRSGSHATAGCEIEAEQPALFHDGDQAEVLCKHIDVVVRRNGDAELELARQVGRAEQGFGIVCAIGGLGQPVDPQLPIGTRLGLYVAHDALCPLVDLGVCQGQRRVDRADHVAHIVATGGKRGQPRRVDPTDHVAQSFLTHTVVLEGLARGDAQAAARVTHGQLIEVEPLLRAQHAARQAHAHHELVVGLELLTTTLIAQVTIILLVTAVELQQLGVGLADCSGRGIGQSAGDGATQETAVCLDVLEGGKLVAHDG